MLNRFKKSISVLMIGAAMVSTTMMTAPKADAGIILALVGIGIVLLIVGIADQSMGLVILDNTTNVSPVNTATINVTNISAGLLKQYHGIGLDTAAANDLAGTILAKSKVSPTDATGKTFVTLSTDELSTAMKASTIEVTNPMLFNQLVTDMKAK